MQHFCKPRTSSMQNFSGSPWFQWRNRGAIKRNAVFALTLSSVVLLMATLLNRQIYSDFLLRSLEGPIRYDNPEFLLYLKNEVIDPPSRRDYNLSNSEKRRKEKNWSEGFYDKWGKHLFSNKRGRFFVEAGALDGEAMSNTLWLERDNGWEGLLVEPNPSSYKILKTRNRKAWSANVCLSRSPFPGKEMMTSAEITEREQFRAYLDTIPKAMNKIVSLSRMDSANVGDNVVYVYTQCVPLESLLLVLNIKRIDLLSLDVEGFEMEILSHFDFDYFNVQVIFLEWQFLNRSSQLVEWMARRKYLLYRNGPFDMIFVRRESEYEMDMLERNETGRFMHFIPKFLRS